MIPPGFGMSNASCAKAGAGIPEQELDRSAYLLFGEPAQMAEALAERQQAYGLSRITIMAESGIELAPPDPLRFCRAVVPLL